MNRNGPELEQVVPEISVLCVKKSSIRYGFRFGPRAIRYNVDLGCIRLTTLYLSCFCCTSWLGEEFSYIFANEFSVLQRP